MSKIHQLPPHIVAKIAAGEVIERPAYAVKELIENAIDARADDIQVYVENAGLTKIMVTDNGEGMDKKDLSECYNPHTTSKTAVDDELIGIQTLGFRGEALASLASISKLTIKSRPHVTGDKSFIGYQIEVDYGKTGKISPVGMPFGTVVIAENLFAQIPARKKFLKSVQTELRYITDIVSHYALSYPSIHFSLIHNKRQLLNFSPSETLEERVISFLGKDITQFLIPIKQEESFITIQGFLMHPQYHSSTTSKQFLFINNRSVFDKAISLAVKEAYATLLDNGSYPIFVLHFTIPYEMVDVNIHPRKEQIGLLNSQATFSIIKMAVAQTLTENNITFQNISWKTGVGITQSFAGQLLRNTVLDKNIFTLEKEATVTQLHNLYILYETKNGFIFIDQHAAHERILFEKLSKEFLKQKRKHTLFQLKDPVVLHVSPSEILLLEEYKKILKKLGFVFYFSSEVKPSREAFSNNFITEKVILTHVPFLFQDRNQHKLISEILESIQDGIPTKHIDMQSQKMIAFLACRGAVKAGDTLTKEKMKQIIQDLEKTRNNSTCPHGRPTHIFVSMKDFNANFKR